MLVFCTSFSLGSSVPLRMVSISVCSWLNNKGHFGLSVDNLTSGADLHYPHGNWVRSWKTPEGEFPMALSISYSHPDSEIQGRFWTIEIGARRFADSQPLEVSIRLRTEEQSTKVIHPAELSVPFIVHDLLKDGNPPPSTPGLSIHVLEKQEDLEKLNSILLSPPRHHPIILISKDPSTDKPLINVEYFRQKVEGLADIFVYPNYLSRSVASLVGPRCAVWDGGISFVWAVHDRDKPEYYRGYIFTPNDIQTMGCGVEDTAEQTLLRELTHTTNWLNERHHISPEHVRELIRVSELRKARTIADLTGDYRLLAEQMAEELAKVKDEYGKREKDYDEYIENIESKRDELELANKKLAQDFENSQLSLRAAEVSLGHDKSDSALPVLRDLVGPFLDPESALRVISRLFPNHVIVLDDAFQSAVQSKQFRDRAELWRLLWLFSTDYWEALSLGHQGDAEARKIFGSHYAAHEGESTRSSKKFKNLRTFVYQGKEIVMDAHLKVGTTSPSPVEAIRVHFHWDSDKSVLIIGYCGRHLNTISGS